MSDFTPDTAAALPGPEWLRARRVAAAERFASMTLPTEAEEVWRYSRVSELDLDAYSPVDASKAPTDVPAAVEAAIAAAGPRSGLLVAVGGRIVRRELAPELAERGVVLGGLTELEDADADDVLGCAAGEPTEAFGELNAAFVGDVALLRVPDGVVVRDPIVVVNWVDGDGTAVFPRTVVQVGRDAEVTVLDHHGSADVAALTVPVTELDVAEAGRLRFLNVQT